MQLNCKHICPDYTIQTMTALDLEVPFKEQKNITSKVNPKPLLNIFTVQYLLPFITILLLNTMMVTTGEDCRVNTELFQAALLFDSTVAHGLGFAHSLAGNFKGSAFVGCYTLAICAQIWLDLLPYFLLGVQLLVWFTCNQEVISMSQKFHLFFFSLIIYYNT